MRRIYLVVGPVRAVVAVCCKASDIDLDIMAESVGSPVELYEIGIAHPETPPGRTLIGDAADITRYGPLGRKVEATATTL